MKGLSRETTGYLLAFAGVAMFAGTLPATRLAVETLPPWFVTFGRAAIAGVLAGIVLLALKRPWPSLTQAKGLAISGVMVLFGFPGFMALAMQTAPAGHGGVVLGVLPILTAVLGAIRNKEQPGAAFWMLSALGSAIVIGYTLLAGGRVGLERGDLLLLLAALSASTGYVFAAEVSKSMPGWEVISWTCLMFLPVTMTAALLTLPADLAAVAAPSWWGFAYAALFSQFIGFFAWNSGLAMGGITRVSQVQFLQTFMTIGFAALVNGERIGPDALAAAGVIVVILFVMRRLKRT